MTCRVSRRKDHARLNESRKKAIHSPIGSGNLHYRRRSSGKKAIDRSASIPRVGRSGRQNEQKETRWEGKKSGADLESVREVTSAKVAK